MDNTLKYVNPRGINISKAQKALGDLHWTKRPEVREKMRKAKVGYIPWNKGKVFSPYSDFSQIVRSCDKYAKWRLNIFEMDNFKCIQCGDERGGNLQADHIKPLAHILKVNSIKTIHEAENCKDLWDTSNGRTLCKDCHAKTDTFAGRATNYFK